MEQLKNLNLDGKLSENDLQNLLKGFEGSLNNKKKNPCFKKFHFVATKNTTNKKTLHLDRSVSIRAK